MKLAKATIYYYSHEDEDNPTDALNEILDLKDWAYAKLYDIEQVEIGEWYEEIQFNKRSVSKEDFEHYFNLDNELIDKMVDDFLKLWETMAYTGLNYETILSKVLLNYRELNEAEKQHFMGRIQ